jgi:hypothetical protein
MSEVIGNTPFLVQMMGLNLNRLNLLLKPLTEAHAASTASTCSCSSN